VEGDVAALPDVPSTPMIDYRCCRVEDLLPSVHGARLIVSDPPWGEYEQRPGRAAPDSKYETLKLEDIVEHIDRAWMCAAPGARLALWYCWPLQSEILDSVRSTRWGDPVTGGAWVKVRRKRGVGYHWLGASEPVAVFRKAGRVWTDRTARLDNAFVSGPTQHSRKPVEWQRQWMRRWVPPDGLVFDMYAGLASVAEAALREGRAYVGAECGAARHAEGMSILQAVPR
jgi:hypothetical protein